MAKIARGERNNNPGNIRHGAKWQGLASTQTDKDFCQFISPEYGIRAIYKLIQTYQKKYGLNTIKTIIYRYASFLYDISPPTKVLRSRQILRRKRRRKRHNPLTIAS